MLPMIVPIDEDVDIIQYLQHGFVSKTNVETPYPTLNLSRHVPLTNIPLSSVDRISFNNCGQHNFGQTVWCQPKGGI